MLFYIGSLKSKTYITIKPSFKVVFFFFLFTRFNTASSECKMFAQILRRKTIVRIDMNSTMTAKRYEFIYMSEKSKTI